MMQLGGRHLESHELTDVGFRRLGKDVRIHERASIYGAENIEIGDHVRIDDFVVIIATGPLRIGSHVSIPNFCFLGARNGIMIEDFATLAPGVKVFSASDDYSGEYLTNPTVPREFTGGTAGPVHIGRHVIIGAGSILLPCVTLSEGCAVGALSLVKQSLDSWTIYGGVPVRRIGERSRSLLSKEKELLKRV
jgi:acetyltransferase-like isoleucine patch superfamily enzyme